MYLQELIHSNCPYCGENIELAIDCSVPQQSYIEDCQVCCRPITVSVEIDAEGIPSVITQDENDS